MLHGTPEERPATPLVSASELRKARCAKSNLPLYVCFFSPFLIQHISLSSGVPEGAWRPRSLLSTLLDGGHPQPRSRAARASPPPGPELSSGLHRSARRGVVCAGAVSAASSSVLSCFKSSRCNKAFSSLAVVVIGETPFKINSRK